MCITIYYNPACGTARSVLEMIRHAGIEPKIITYLKTPPTLEELEALVQQGPITARDLLRTKEKLYTELGLDKPNLSETTLLQAIVDNPILLNRPVVVSPKGVKVCRPAETVLSLFP
ncbi:MAG: arsenate reductase (glutaredoxin) [Acetobacter sp.]|nr:arsenate reductase (glutaredoxin) [Acetobacter sp.]